MNKKTANCLTPFQDKRQTKRRPTGPRKNLLRGNCLPPLAVDRLIIRTAARLKDQGVQAVFTVPASDTCRYTSIVSRIISSEFSLNYSANFMNDTDFCQARVLRSACSRSSRISSTASIPADTRTSPSRMPTVDFSASVRERCDAVAGCKTRV